MKNDLLVVGVFVLWHLSMVSSLAGYAGSRAETWFIPKTILASRSHLLGLLALSLGIIVTLGSAHAGLLAYGIFVGAGLGITDTLLTYRAVIQWSRSP